MTWSGDYSQCVGCQEVYPYATDKCPCCRSECRTYVTAESNGFDSRRRFELIGEQKQVLTLPPRGAVLIKGGAGSGKTLVSVKRAEYLTKNYSDLFQRSKTAIFTYNKELAFEIQNLVSDKTIGVYNIDSWVYRFLSANGLRPAMFKAADLRECRVAAAQSAFASVRERAIAKKTDDFYAAEIAWLKGRRISSLDVYKKTKRTGRGTEDRVTAVDRECLWQMFVEYNGGLAKRGIRDWEDRVLDALQIVEQEGFRPPFTHVVVDEAQDFTFAKIALIRRLVSSSTESITIVADSAQQIYQSGFSWADLGIRVVGRSVEFRRNYRNTRQISEAAYSLMSHDADDSDYTKMECAQKEGDRPLVVRGSELESGKALVEMIRRLPKEEDSVVAVPTHQMIFNLESMLVNSGIKVLKSVSEKCEACCVRLSTYHALKGLQFDHVFLWAASERNFPTIAREPDEVSKSRKLLYVAMTRATRRLVIFTSCMPSKLIEEIEPSLLEFKALT